MKRGLPIVRPPWWLIAIFAVPLVLSQVIWSATELWVWWNFGTSLEDTSLSAHILRQETRTGFCSLFAFAYGVFRAVAFHPINRREYHFWLANSPWTSRLPLPLGPIHLVWQDLLFVVPAILIAWGPDESLLLRVPLAFLWGYLPMLTQSLFLTGERWIGYAACFAGGLALHFSVDSIASGASVGPILAVALCSYPLLWWGLRRSLARFATWETSFDLGARLLQSFGYSTKPDDSGSRLITQQLGWPFDSLPLQQRSRIWDRRDEIMISLLAGWWLYASQFEILLDLLRGYAFAAPFLMAGYYWAVCRPPISLWGRLRTGRLILPRYDRCFLWPLFMFAIQLAWTGVAFELGLTSLLASAVQLTLVMWCIFRAVAAFEAFRLTGAYRMTVPHSITLMNRQAFTNA